MHPTRYNTPTFTLTLLHPMYADWIDYLNTLNLASELTTNKQTTLAPLRHLSVLSVAGADAATFLQGQLTCDIRTLENGQTSLAAFCNAKGRTISSFIIIKQEAGFLLVLSKELLTKVQKKLQMYILRSDVQLSDQSEQLCLVGIHNAELSQQNGLYPYPQQDNSFLFIANSEQAQTFCTELSQQDISLVDENAWLALDIQAGIPWLLSATSEEFVPQMLNLDKLGAISFEKGCYTGQEIVARTHYLGKNKRAMYAASCTATSDIEIGCSISAVGTEDSLLGTVVLSSRQGSVSQLLVVLKDQANDADSLQLNNKNHDKITLN